MYKPGSICLPGVDMFPLCLVCVCLFVSVLNVNEFSALLL
jgi:hypothetical protein